MLHWATLVEWRRPEPDEYNHLAERLLPLELPEGRWAPWVDPQSGVIWAIPIDMAGGPYRKRKKLGKLTAVDEQKYLYYVLDGYAVRVDRATYRQIGNAPRKRTSSKPKATKPAAAKTTSTKPKSK